MTNRLNLSFFIQANMKSAVRSSLTALRACRSSALPLLATRVPTVARATSVSSLRVLTPSRSYAAAAVKLTSESYPELQRGDYGKLSEEDVTYFKSILAPGSILEDAEDLVLFNEDWMRKYKGASQLVLKPKTVDQVSLIMKHCNLRKLAVVPQGGNTGLVGGSIPVFDEIVLSLANMNQIRSFDKTSGILVSDAGVILENADKYLADSGYIFPLDLGAKGSCHVGGVVATNAGGLRLLRYGSLHGSILGIEAVLADGTVVNNLSTLRKDNTGYDLKQLFIGSEGTLGVITGISILCPPRPTAVNVAFLGLESFEQVQSTFVKAKKELSEILSAFECMDNTSQDIVGEHTDLVRPLAEKYPFYVLIETSGSCKEHDDEKLERFLENAMTEELVVDGVVAQDAGEVSNLWQWRELIPEALGKGGGVYKYDVSIPLSKLYDLVGAVGARLEAAGVVGPTDEFPVIATAGYGHIGDGNLHLNVPVRRYDKKVEKILEPFVYEWIETVKGSISAEHGLGLAKKNYIQYSKDPVLIKMMKDIKKHYDPNGILNPYKYI